MTVTYTWGSWEEQWRNGRFRCVFTESQPQPDGMICATGLYQAVDGDALHDIDTYRDTIMERAAIITDNSGQVLVRSEFAELLTLMPAFLRELTERLDEMSPRTVRPKAVRGTYSRPLSDAGSGTQAGPRMFLR